jgi:hypothetical protein
MQHIRGDFMTMFTPLLFLMFAARVPAHASPPSSLLQDTLTVKEAEPGLKAQAKVASDSAMRIALAKVPGGKIREAELEKEYGKLVYSFDITRAQRSGVEEVLVDAHSGKVLSSKHESAAAEAKEQSAESGHAMSHDTASPGAMMKHDTTTMSHDSAR